MDGRRRGGVDVRPPASGRDPTAPPSRPRRVRRPATWIWLLAVIAVLPLPWHQLQLKGDVLVDLHVYREAGLSLLHHRPVYAQYVNTQYSLLPFTYPPPAAVLAVPLALLPLRVDGAIWFVAILLLLAWIARLLFAPAAREVGRRVPPARAVPGPGVVHRDDLPAADPRAVPVRPGRRLPAGPGAARPADPPKTGRFRGRARRRRHGHQAHPRRVRRRAGARPPLAGRGDGRGRLPRRRRAQLGGRPRDVEGRTGPTSCSTPTGWATTPARRTSRCGGRCCAPGSTGCRGRRCSASPSWSSAWPASGSRRCAWRRGDELLAVTDRRSAVVPALAGRLDPPLRLRAAAARAAGARPALRLDRG